MTPSARLAVLLPAAATLAFVPAPTPEARPVPPVFADMTEAVGVRFAYVSSHTPKKYLLETMGPGVALLD